MSFPFLAFCPVGFLVFPFFLYSVMLSSVWVFLSPVCVVLLQVPGFTALAKV